MKKIFLAGTILIAQFCFSQKVMDAQVDIPKKKESLSEISKEKILFYNDRFSAFINALKSSSDRNVFDALLSDKVKAVVTDRVLKKLSDSIRLDHKMEVFQTGSQTLIDGEKYPMIQYRYSDDKASVPKNIITVLFEENGKIIGIKPSQKDE